MRVANAAGAEEPDDLPGYRLRRLLWRNAAGGEVWEAEGPGGILVNVHIFPVRDVSHGQLENLRGYGRLRHAGLIQLHCFAQYEDRFVIVSELATRSLRDVEREPGHQGTRAAGGSIVAWCRQAAEALDFLHLHNMRYGDVKPSTLQLVENQVKLELPLWDLLRADDGLSSSCGTPIYMAPEMWQGKPVPQSDQYALACTYAELRLGRRLFAGTEFRQVMQSHLEQQPDLSSLPNGEKAVLLRALAKKPAERFRTCTEFMAALAVHTH